MKSKRILDGALCLFIRELMAILCIAMLVPGNEAFAMNQAPQSGSSEGQPAKIPADQLDSLVAPIALYPDPMLSQVLIASTYPLEVIQLQQWLEANSLCRTAAKGQGGGQGIWRVRQVIFADRRDFETACGILHTLAEWAKAAPQRQGRHDIQGCHNTKI